MTPDLPTARTRILIVEDEAIVACDLQSRLESFGYEVVGIAASGEQAVSLAADTSPDLVLMDIQLRGRCDGIQVAETLRAEHGVGIIFLSAHSTEDMLTRAKLTEPLAYLLKPYQERELEIAINVALYKRQAERVREELIRQLEKALAEVKTLRGLIPICAWCRKLRSDDGFWMSVEQYFRAHTEADCSHGICPDCLKRQLDAGS
jgi:CheY-like chemotaxis protein